MKISTLVIVFAFLLPASHVNAQDDLMDMFGDTEPATEYAFATFKSTRISLGQSVENPANGNLIFDIQHHLGPANRGFEDFFGLDQATTRLGLQYGITDWLMVGIGRTTL
jgi:hypothetical protein